MTQLFMITSTSLHSVQLLSIIIFTQLITILKTQPEKSLYSHHHRVTVTNVSLYLYTWQSRWGQ